MRKFPFQFPSQVEQVQNNFWARVQLQESSHETRGSGGAFA